METTPRKHWLDFTLATLSVIAIAVSFLSWHISRQTAETALVPHINVSNLHLGTYSPTDTLPTLTFEIRNSGQARATEVQVAMLAYDGTPLYIPTAAYVPSLDPGDDASEATVPLRFGASRPTTDYLSGKLPLEITVETTSDSKWTNGYHACSVFELSQQDGRFKRRSGCRPDLLEMMKKWGQLPK